MERTVLEEHYYDDVSLFSSTFMCVRLGVFKFLITNNVRNHVHNSTAHFYHRSPSEKSLFPSAKSDLV